MVRRSIVDLITGLEAAGDRLKFRYKQRFDRFAPAQVVPYRSYGRPDLLVVRGRVVEETSRTFHAEPGVWTNIRHTLRRFRSAEIPGAIVRARFEGRDLTTATDGEGYFELRIEPERDLEPGWHRVWLSVDASPTGETAEPTHGEVLVPPRAADYVVVSDLDDTVLHSAATNKLLMVSVVLLNDARSRAPFDGVGDLYRAFQGGPDGDGQNPILYLSRSPVNLYDMIVEFMEHHDVPPGPLLLMDWGIRNTLVRAEIDYKRGILDGLLAFYPDRRFILIGDSGQQDPEIYSALATEHPDRVACIIIRDVATVERDAEVRALAERVHDAGVPMVLVQHSREAAEHAARLGLLPEDAATHIHPLPDNEEPLWRRAINDEEAR